MVANSACSKKVELGNVAAAKIKKLTDELEELDSNKLDAVERIKSGFINFKKNNYEYVKIIFLIRFSFFRMDPSISMLFIWIKIHHLLHLLI